MDDSVALGKLLVLDTSKAGYLYSYFGDNMTVSGTVKTRNE
jgi:hypothetical protein